MSKKADFKIEFDKKEHVYTAGNTVSGKVTISPLESFECRDIIVSIYWSTHGKGNRDKKELETISSGSQRLVAGKDIVIPFSCQLPCSPLTYHGTYINIDYYVKAKIDIALKSDPSFEKDFLVSQGTEYFPSSKSLYGKKKLSAKSAVKTPIVFWIIGIILLIVLAILFIGVWYIFVALFIISIYRPVMNKYAMKKTGKITVEAGDGLIHPGKKLPVTLFFTPAADLNLNCAKAKLLAEEKAVSGSGTNTTTHTFKLVEESFDLPIEKHIRKGESVKCKFDLPIPDIAAYTFDTSDNSVKWRLALHIGLDRWPDWKHTIDLTLCPDVKIVEMID
jgi:hypothetical protein